MHREKHEIEAKFPGVKQIYAEAWKVFERSVVRIFGVSVLSVVVGLMVASLAVGGVLVSGFRINLEWLVADPWQFYKAVQFTPVAVLVVVGFLGVRILWEVWVQAAIRKILITDGSLSVWQALGATWGMILSLWLTMALVIVMRLGATMALVLPGLVLALLTVFTEYEVVAGRSSLFVAVKRSAQMVLAHFEGVVLNLAVYWAGYIIVFWGLPQTAMRNVVAWGLMVAVLSFVGIVVQWFYLSLTAVLYAHAKEGMRGKHSSGSWWWLWGIVALGWMFAASMGWAGYTVVKRYNVVPWLIEEIKKGVAEEDRVGVRLDGPCGISVAVPSTEDEVNGVKRRWMYDDEQAKLVYRGVEDAGLVPAGVEIECDGDDYELRWQQPDPQDPLQERLKEDLRLVQEKIEGKIRD